MASQTFVPALFLFPFFTVIFKNVTLVDWLSCTWLPKVGTFSLFEKFNSVQTELAVFSLAKCDGFEKNFCHWPCVVSFWVTMLVHQNFIAFFWLYGFFYQTCWLFFWVTNLWFSSFWESWWVGSAQFFLFCKRLGNKLSWTV